MNVIGDVKGKSCLILDDIVDTAGTLVKTVDALYAAGAALCVFNTWVSIAAIVLVQLNYAVAPRLFRHKE